MPAIGALDDAALEERFFAEDGLEDAGKEQDLPPYQQLVRDPESTVEISHNTRIVCVIRRRGQPRRSRDLYQDTYKAAEYLLQLMALSG